MVIAEIKEGFTETWTEPLYQYDRGQTLVITGIELPPSFEIHFSNTREGGMAVAYMGHPEGVHIPNILLTTGETIYAWFYVTDHDNHEGKSEHTIIIPVNRRPMAYPVSSDEGVTNGFIVDDDETLIYT